MGTYYRGGGGGWRDARGRDDVRCHHVSLPSYLPYIPLLTLR